MNRLATVAVTVLVCWAVGVIQSGRTCSEPVLHAEEVKGVKKELINPEKLYRSPYYTQAIAVRGGKTIHVSG